MGESVPLSSNFDGGFVSDAPRDEMGQNAAFRMRDYIPRLEAPLRKRGGWAFASPNLNGLGGVANNVATLGFLPFPADGHVIAISDSGSAYQVKQFDGGGGLLVPDTGDKTIVPTWPIFWHKTGAKAYGIVLGGLGQTAKAPKKYYNTGGGVYRLDPLGGTPPMARGGISWGDYLLLFNFYDPSDSGNLKNFRLAFSAVGDPDTFVLSGVNAGTFDFPEEVVAAALVRNTTLVWGYNHLWLLNGDTPPPGGNLDRKILYAGQGTFDGRSVTTWRDYAIWANASGVYSSDGATLTDLTGDGGISLYYRSLVKNFAQTQGWSAAGSILRDHYILTIRNAAGVYITTLMCDLSRKIWMELTNISAANFAHVFAGPGTALYGGGEELFFAHRTLPYVCKLSTIWTPSITYAYDADGRPVLPSLETPFYHMSAMSLKRVRSSFITYDLRVSDATPTLRVYRTFNPAVDAGYDAKTFDLIATTKERRVRAAIANASLGFGLRIDQTAASADTRIFSVEAEGHPQETTRGTR